MPANSHIQTLFEKYMNNACTKEEWNELLAIVREENSDADLQQAFKNYWDSLPTATTDPEYWNTKFLTIMEEAKANGAPVVKMRRRWIKWVAAACIIALVGVAAYVILSTGDKPATVGHEGRLAHDVPAPSNTRAVITLADGTKVYLDSAGNGTIAQENDVNVIKNANGEVVYAMSPAGGGGLSVSPNRERPGVDVAYNTLFNPRGSKVISLTLSDGTHVWLNSESSLRYPASFTGNTREVEITGEAYFEVAHLSTPALKGTPASGGQSANGKAGLIPFIVKKGDVSVTVLGTHFNVNAYDDEEALKVTLLEGSVQVSAKLPGLPFSAVKIKPGQQAVVGIGNSELGIRKNIDVNEVMAWKNGLFSFEDAGIEAVMKQIARWYDVEVVYQDKPTKFFRGSIPRDMSAAKVFAALEETGGVHFKIEGKKVTVLK